MATYTLVKGVPSLRHQLSVDEVTDCDPTVVETILELDLVTFSDPPNTHFTSAAFVRHGRVYLLKSDDVAIGTCICMRSWKDPSEVVILKVAIRTGYRNRGFGSYFMTRVLDQLAEQGCRSVVLQLDVEDARAFHIYEQKLSFQRVVHCGPESPNGTATILMRRDLSIPDPLSSGDFDL